MSRDAPVVVIGCGMAGLGAAAALKRADADYLILEEEDGPGGLLRSKSIDGYWFDRAGHFFHSGSASLTADLAATGLVLEKHRRHSAVIVDGAIVPFPLQFNLWAAPAALREGVRGELASGSLGGNARARNLEELFLSSWGPSLYYAFFKPYQEKMLGSALADLPADWGAQFMPRLDLDTIKKGLDQPVDGYGYNSVFNYPEAGRIGVVPEALAVQHGTRLRFGTRVTSVDLQSRTLRMSDGSSISFSSIVSTAPLPNILDFVGAGVSPEAFTCSNILNVRVGFKGHLTRGEHWYYVPDRNRPFFRIGVPNNVNTRASPPGRASLSIECGMGHSTQSLANANEIAQSAIDLLARLGVVACETVEVIDAHVIAPAYVANRMAVTPSIRAYAESLARDGIMVAGRYGAWDYFSIGQSYESGLAAAERSLKWQRGG